MKNWIKLYLFLLTCSRAFSQGDTPCTAVSLAVNSGICSTYTSGTTVGAAYQSNAANGGVPTCASPGAPDVWYSFVAPASGLVTITTSAGTITDSGIQIYSSSNNLCSGTLTGLNCDDDSGPGTMSELNLCGLTGGNTYWIRVWKYGGSGTGTFNICVYTINAPVNVQNCSGATQVCSNAPFSGNSSGFSTQELNSCNQGCLSVEHQSSWYIFQIQTSGTLNMTISPNPGVDYDYALWGPNPSCPPAGTPFRCSYASGAATNGATGSYNTGIGSPGTETSDGTSGTLDGWTNTINATAGEVYVLLIDNFTADATPFNLNWGGTAGMNCTPLPMEVLNFSGYNTSSDNVLVWSTPSEKQSQFFKLERSVDGYNYIEIAKIQAEGESHQSKNYSFHDITFDNTINYYRLSQIDDNGKIKGLNMVVINNTVEAPKVIKITNAIGQDMPADSDGLRFIYYSNGSVVKKMGN